MSDTPRTDDGEYFIDGDRGIVDSGLGRRLERELNAAHFIIRQQQLLIEENLGLKERIKRLEEAGDPLCAAAAFMGWHLEIEKWNKAKEVKL